jgi:hypothetical protein
LPLAAENGVQPNGGNFVAGTSGCSATVDRGDRRNDGETKPEAIVGGTVVRPVERLEDAFRAGRAYGVATRVCL